MNTNAKYYADQPQNEENIMDNLNVMRRVCSPVTVYPSSSSERTYAYNYLHSHSVPLGEPDYKRRFQSNPPRPASMKRTGTSHLTVAIP